MTTSSLNEFKKNEHDSWAANADGWKRQDALLRKCAAPVTERMLDLAGISAGHRHLDIASGLGEPAISAAHRVGENGYVMGTDLVDEMLHHARDKATKAGLNNIEFHCVDGEALDCPPATFDAATIRWGLMFMPEPEACATLAHTALKDEGRLVVACWGAPERNPFVGVLIKVLGKYMDLPKPPPGTPGIFALADPDRLTTVLASAGFRDIALEELEFDVVEVEDGRGYWQTMSDLAAPVMRLVKQLDENTRKAYIDEVVATADAIKEGDTLRMKGVTWIASAVK